TRKHPTRQRRVAYHTKSACFLGPGRAPALAGNLMSREQRAAAPLVRRASLPELAVLTTAASLETGMGQALGALDIAKCLGLSVVERQLGKVCCLRGIDSEAGCKRQRGGGEHRIDEKA